MSDDKLGPMPDPEVEKAAENPGGVDAINEDAPFAGDQRGPYGRDLDPEKNPEVEDQLPDDISQPDDKTQDPDDESQQGPDKEDPV
ncbi:hypothetical protein [Nocardioides coralli]|uniref:hypothetical protein n=1 Tax=Nocardioides coralli TaxID=2872154 RepID=UPI001CA42C2C|nr:hypothetical protein [Nocardioides coralli]QZY29645.1 hypothetical protein K6T13_02830 [Nocardioides coralli]